MWRVVRPCVNGLARVAHDFPTSEPHNVGPGPLSIGTGANIFNDATRNSSPEHSANLIDLPAVIVLRYYNNPVSLLQRFKAISESVGASDEGTAKDKFFAEIDGLLDDIYVGLLTDGSNGTYGYSGLEPSEETKKATCQALAEFIY